MPVKKSFLLYTALLLLVGSVNFLFRKKIPYAYADLLSYNRLYAVKDQFNLAYLGRLRQDSIVMQFSGTGVSSQNNFQVSTGDKFLSVLPGRDLRMRPLPGVNRYKVRVNNRDSFDMQIEMYHGDSLPWFTLFRPVVGAHLYTADWWAWKETEKLPPQDQQMAERILYDSMQIRPDQPSREKVIRIARYLLSRTVDKRGTPADFLAALSPLAQWRCIISGQSLLYCGNYSRIFAWFSNRAGVPCRMIESGSIINDLSDGDHMYNETYLSEEGLWAYVDLMDGNVFVRKNAQLLNSIDVQRLLRYDGPDPGFVALHYQGDSLAELPFRDASLLARDCFNPNNVFTFYYGNYMRITQPHDLLGKLGAFLYAKPYYSLYSDKTDLPGYPFYIRVATQIVFVAGLVAWLAWSIIGISNRFWGSK
jgi:hypothetical protein